MKYLLAIGLWLLSLSAQAAGWTVDPATSTIGFTASQSGQAFSGHFRSWAAQIDFDPAKPVAGHALITIDMASAMIGDKQKDEALPGSDWFDVKQFPQAVYEATKFQSLGDGKYEAIGTLTIRGVKKDVILPFTFKTENDQAIADGSVQILRTDFGIGQGDWQSDEYVAKGVTVTIHLVAKAN
jgi:polyisoprenoid-binding protein YceI